MGKNSGTIRHTITGVALALALAAMLAGCAGTEARGCDWAERAFWERGKPARVAVQVDRCIAAVADTKARAEGGLTPLHVAAARGTPETVAALLDAGADPKARDADGHSPADMAEHNPAVRDHAIFRRLNQARFD